MVWPWSPKRLAFGRKAEIRGAFYLRSLGYRLLACPYQARDGEIDIVADEDGCLVFVEVKARRGDANPEDAVTLGKRARIVRAARQYRREYRGRCRYRYDILAIVQDDGGDLHFRLFRDAFRDEGAEAPPPQTPGA